MINIPRVPLSTMIGLMVCWGVGWSIAGVLGYLAAVGYGVAAGPSPTEPPFGLMLVFLVAYLAGVAVGAFAVLRAAPRSRAIYWIGALVACSTAALTGYVVGRNLAGFNHFTIAAGLPAAISLIVCLVLSSPVFRWESEGRRLSP